MILGVIVFSLLFVVFVVFGTLLICGKGYIFVSGYRGLTDEEKQEFVSKNNLKKIFSFYAYYCFAVAGVTLLALIGACCNSMVVIFISYLLFGAGTIATLIIVNVNSNFKMVPVVKDNKVVSNNTAQVKPEHKTATEVNLTVEKEEEPAVENKAESAKEVETKTPAKRTTTKKGTTSSAGTKKTSTKTTATKSSTKSKTSK